MNKQHLARRVCGGVFGIYVLLMVYLLFLQRRPADNYWEFLRTSPNLTPFATLRHQFAVLSGWPLIQQVGGNVVMFLPLGLLPAIWEKQRRFPTCLLTVTLIVFSVELLQWVTTLGYADVDDLLLNIPAACLGYCVWAIGNRRNFREA